MEYENDGGRDGMLYVAGYESMVVPAGQGSSSSDTSDVRCDSSRSEASPCSSVSSEDGLLRLPLLLPQGFPSMPVRFAQRGSMKIYKPGDGGIYYVRPQGDTVHSQFFPQPGGMKVIKHAMCADNGVYYVKPPSEALHSHGLEMLKTSENITGDANVYYMKNHNISQTSTPQVNNHNHEHQSLPSMNGARFIKSGDALFGDVSDNLMNGGVKMMKPVDAVYGAGNMFYMKPQALQQPMFHGMKILRAEEGGMYYMKHEAPMPVQHQQLHAPHPVPVGWRRLIVDNSVIYLSPSNVALSNFDQVKLYLQSSGTCKCGLLCPIRVENDFNFNPKVPSRPWDSSDAEMTKLCNHKRKYPPIGSGVIPQKRKKRKASPYAGVSVSQLLAQRERERALAAQVQESALSHAARPRPLPPWQQRVPPIQQHLPPPVSVAGLPPPATYDRKHKSKRKLRDQPTFMDDPNGYLAQQTALLHNTITDAGRDSPVTSTVPPDPRPIQGGTVSTSEGSPPLVTPPAQSPSGLLVSSSLEPCYPTAKPHSRKSPMNVVPSVVTSMAAGTSAGQQHFLVSGSGHYLGGLKLSQPSSMGTVLVNAMPGPFVLQPGMMAMDAGLGLVTGNVLVDNPPPLLSPDRKRKGKRRRTALGSPLMQMPSPVVSQGFAGVLVPGKNVVVNNPINVLQPVVQNLPLPQLLMPGLGNLGNMVMTSDGSTALLHDPTLNQLQLQPLLTNTSMISTPTGMLIRSPNTLVGQVSPQEYIQLVPHSSGAVVQQNTTIVQQQTTMMANVEKPLELEIVASQSQQQSVSTQTCGSKETSQAFCQTVSSPPPVADTTTTDDASSYVTSSVDEKFSMSVSDESVVSSHFDIGTESQTVVPAVPRYLDAEETPRQKLELQEGDLVWGTARGSAAWPGQIVGPVSEDGLAIVRWFGGASALSKVNVMDLQTLSEGLDAHHQANNASRRTRKLRVELETAIQEAMIELDRMAVQKKEMPSSTRTRRNIIKNCP